MNTSDVIQALKNLFNQFIQSAAFFLNWGQHFENSIMKEYIKKQEVRLFFSLSSFSKFFNLIE